MLTFFQTEGKWGLFQKVFEIEAIRTSFWNGPGVVLGSAVLRSCGQPPLEAIKRIREGSLFFLGGSWFALLSGRIKNMVGSPARLYIYSRS